MDREVCVRIGNHEEAMGLIASATIPSLLPGIPTVQCLVCNVDGCRTALLDLEQLLAQLSDLALPVCTRAARGTCAACRPHGVRTPPALPVLSRGLVRCRILAPPMWGTRGLAPSLPL